MKTLVTGGGGFLGRYVIEQLLARGVHVRSFARGPYPELAALGVECLRGDLRDRQQVTAACQGCDVIHHVAAVAGIWGSWNHYYGINTLGTKNLIECAQACGVEKLVYTSSPSVTFTGADQQGVDESVPYASKWLCHYPKSKALAEQAVLQAHGRRGLATCALRPHLIWGPGDQHLIPRLIARARAGQLRRIGSGQNLIDIVYVENAAAAQLQAADALSQTSPVGGQAYFISQGEPVNCWQWIGDVLSLAGLPPNPRAIPFPVAWCVGGCMELVHWLTRSQREPRMTRFLASQLAKSHWFEIGRARRDFGYEPTVTTAEGMRRLAESIRM